VLGIFQRGRGFTGMPRGESTRNPGRNYIGDDGWICVVI